MESSLNRLLGCMFLSLFIAGFGFSEEIVHILQKGETIYSIARSFGLSADEVLKYNKISDPSKVQIGTKIRIPGTSTAPATTPVRASSPGITYDEYRVEKNETLYSLARRYGISVAELLEINGFSSNHVLKAGELLKVPVLPSSKPETQPSGQPLGQSGPSVQTGTAGSGTTGSSQPPSSTSGNAEIATTIIKLDPAIKWPIKAKEISQITGKLNGVQVTGERRESVKSLTGGTVVSAGPYRGFGRVAIVQTTTGYLYVYGGCETLSVKEGDKVSSGAELGKLGIDTKTAKSQLFFFVYKGNTPVDPIKAPRA